MTNIEIEQYIAIREAGRIKLAELMKAMDDFALENNIPFISNDTKSVYHD